MEFLLLGPLEVFDDGHPVVLGGPKQRALLAALLLRANQIVSTDRLIDDVWGEKPPATAAKVLHVYVSQLRKVLDPSGHRRLIVTRPPGYSLEVAPEALDLHRFERLVREGRRHSRPETRLRRRAFCARRSGSGVDLRSAISRTSRSCKPQSGSWRSFASRPWRIGSRRTSASGRMHS